MLLPPEAFNSPKKNLHVLHAYFFKHVGDSKGASLGER